MLTIHSKIQFVITQRRLSRPILPSLQIKDNIINVFFVCFKTISGMTKKISFLSDGVLLVGIAKF